MQFGIIKTITLRWHMRRIFIGAMVAIMVFSVAIPPYAKMIAGDNGYIKKWQMADNSDLYMKQIVAADGRMFGVDFSSMMDEQGQKLTCISDGKILWRNDDSFGWLGFECKLMIFERTIIVAGVAFTPSNDSSIPQIICVDFDGKTIWKKTYDKMDCYLDVRIDDKKLWMFLNDKVYVIDPKTGDTIKTADTTEIIKTNKSTITSIMNINPEDMMNSCFIGFAGNSLLTQKNNLIVAYSINEDLSLKYKWEKAIEPSALNLMKNINLIGQANSKYLMLLTGSRTLKCFDSDTGTIKWSQEFDDDFYSQVTYNENCYVIVGNEPLSCHDISNNEKLWELKSYTFVYELTPEYLYGFDEGDHYANIAEGFQQIDIKTGETLANFEVRDAMAFAIDSNDVYVSKNRDAMCYSRCNPCACQINANWAENGTDVVEAELCPLDEREYQIKLENPNEIGSVDCELKPLGKMKLEQSNLSLAPKETKTINARYTAPLLHAVQSVEKIEITTSCNQKIELKLDVKLNKNCPEKLKKVWDIKGTDFHLFGDILVYLSRTSYLEIVENTTVSAINVKTGKTLWNKKVDKIIPKISEWDGTVETWNNLLLFKTDVDYPNCKWTAVDSKTGTVKWQRNDGIPWISNTYYNGPDSRQKFVVNFFDIDTGKTLASKVSIPECRMIFLVLKRNGCIWIRLEYDDDTKEFVSFDEKGKRLWSSDCYPIEYNRDYSFRNLYITDISLSKKVDFTDSVGFNLLQVDIKTGKKLWSVKMNGPDAWAYEDNQKVWATDYISIYCLDIKDGRVIWKVTPDETKRINLFWVWDGLIYFNLVGTQPADFLNSKFIIMSAIDQKNMYTQEIFSNPDLEVEHGKLYAYSTDQQPKNKNVKWEDHVFCVDLKTFQKEWESVGPGNFRRDGDKIIHCSLDEIIWTDKGKQSGRFSLEPAVDRYDSHADAYWVDNRVYCSTKSFALAIDAKTGNQLWKIRTTGDYGYCKIFCRTTLVDNYLDDSYTPFFSDDVVILWKQDGLECYRDIAK